MTRLITTALAGFAVLGAIATTASASSIQTIDCQIDLSLDAERTICASQRLQILDAEITEVYADRMTDRRISPAGKAHLRNSQYAFLTRRNTCGADHGCLAEVMGARLTRIRSLF